MKNKKIDLNRRTEPAPIADKALLTLQHTNKINQPSLTKLWLFLLVVTALLYDLLILNASKNFTDKSMMTISYVQKSNPMREKIYGLVKGYPIEKMTPFISKKDPRTAAYLVSVAKKESNWGKRSPKKDGKECFNYWGYRGPENPTRSGYSCFSSPREAVRVVGGRFDDLIAQNIDEPDEMIIWKCGLDCSSHSPASVKKWIKDVDYYYRKLD